MCLRCHWALHVRWAVSRSVSAKPGHARRARLTGWVEGRAGSGEWGTKIGWTFATDDLYLLYIMCDRI